MTTFGIDISHHQDDIDLDAVLSDGSVGFVAAKITEGATWKDPKFHDFRRAASRNGVLFAGYHFLRGDSTPQAQALNVLEALEGVRVPIIIDIERTNGSPQPKLTHARAFQESCGILGINVVDLLYFPEWYWGEIGQPATVGWQIWQSHYGTNDGKYPGDASSRWNWGSREAEILQFTSTGRVPGYSRDIDRNAYRGTVDQLAETGWFKDYRKEEDVTITEIQKAVASTPIVVDDVGTTQPLQRVLRRILNTQEPDTARIAAAVVSALPADNDLTTDQVEEAVKQALREGLG